jgi:hypothetical protein
MPVKHAFISYVREDSKRVDELQSNLEAAGVKVWRDKDDLAPGTDWETEIRRAITEGSLAFIACFSEASDAREESYQYEELVVAIDQFRKLPPNRQWLFPVRFHPVEPPVYRLGAGRTLGSLQRTDLFGENQNRNLMRLVGQLARVVGNADPEPSLAAGSAAQQQKPADKVEARLRDPSQDIVLAKLVSEVAADIAEQLSQDPFSLSMPKGGTAEERLNRVTERLAQYEKVLKPLGEIFVVGGAWGEQRHAKLWSSAAKRVINTRQESGTKVFIDLQSLIPLYLSYAFAIASTEQDNFSGLNSLLETPLEWEFKRQPMIERTHTGLPFSTESWFGSVIVRQLDGESIDANEIDRYRRGNAPRRYTPVSTYLRSALRPLFTTLIPDEKEFDEVFDRTEVLLGLRAEVARIRADAEDRYAFGGWTGRYTWKPEYFRSNLVQVELSKCTREGQEWTPLQHGLFRSGPELESAFASLAEQAARSAHDQF